MDSAIIYRLFLVLFIFTASQVNAIEFQGNFTQGHFILGKTNPKAQIKVGKKEVKVSNNVAEIIACIRAIEISVETFNDLEKLRIFSDSEYTINCVTKWCETWKKNNWVKYDKKPIKNLDLIKKLYDYYLEYPIEFIHVRSHQTMPTTDTKEYYDWYGNNAADLLAKKSIIVL